MSEGKIIDLNRQRAIHAYQSMKGWLSKLEAEDDTKKKRLKTICRKLPVLISNNGLLTVLTYYKGKKTQKEEESEKNVFRAEEEVSKAIEEWLFKNKIFGKKDTADMIKFLLDCTRQEYIILTKEALEYAIWLKREAESMISE